MTNSSHGTSVRSRAPELRPSDRKIGSLLTCPGRSVVVLKNTGADKDMDVACGETSDERSEDIGNHADCKHLQRARRICVSKVATTWRAMFVAKMIARAALAREFCA